MTAFAFALSLAFCGFMVIAGLGDQPVERSNHDRTTPTAGGLGVVAALAGIAILWPNYYPIIPLNQDFIVILMLLLCMALMGLFDDLWEIPTAIKFISILAAASIAIVMLGPVTILPYASGIIELPYWAGFAGSLLWIFVTTNGVNFMDGANGLMPGSMLISLLGLALVCLHFGAIEPAILCLGLAAGLAGILPYNAREKAKIFTGDVGSLTVGFGYGVAVLWLCRDASLAKPVYIGPVLILPFLTDMFLTMLSRALKRTNLFAPHRTHLYQRLITSGRSHNHVAVYYMMATFLTALWALICSRFGVHAYATFLIAPTLILIWIYYRAGKLIS